LTVVSSLLNTTQTPEQAIASNTGGLVERIKFEAVCSNATCTATVRSERGILRCAGHPADGRIVIPGAMLCTSCHDRNIQRQAQLDAQNLDANLHPQPKQEPVTIEPYAPIPPDYQSASWDWIKQHYPKHARAFNDWHLDPDSVYLHGSSGAGKTMLAAAVTKRHLDISPQTIGAYRNVSIMLDRLRRSINTPERTENLIEQAVVADILILDDLGAEAPSRWTLDRLYVVLEERIEQQRVTFITSNYNLVELRDQLLASKDKDPGLPKAVDRIISRIRGKHRVVSPLNGDDHRIHNKR